MPKQIKELRGFMTGTISSPSSSDVPDEAAIHSKNLETINEEGKLKGCKEEVGKSLAAETAQSYIYQNDDTLPSVGEKFEFYISNELVHTATLIAEDVATEFGYKTFLETSLEACKTAYPPLTSYEVISRVANLGTVPIETVADDIVITNTTVPGEALDDVDTSCFFKTTGGDYVDATADARLFIGQRFKVDDDTEEIMTIAAWEDEAIGQASIMRAQETGDEDGTAGGIAEAHALTDTLLLQADFYAIQITWDAVVDTPSFKIVFTGASGKYWTSEDDGQFMEIHARNMVLKNKKMDDQIRTVSNMVYYDIDNTLTDGTPPAHRMKIVEDFYGNLASPEIKIPENPDVPGEPSSVALTGAATATYIGTGNTTNSKPLWLGEIFEKRFGNKVEGYHLEDAKLAALDDGQAVYSLDHMDIPYTATAGGSPTAALNTDRFICSSPGKYFLIVHKNIDGAETDSWGKQFKTEGIAGEVSAIASSKVACEMFADTDLNDTAEELEPFFAGTWNTAHANTDGSWVDGHGSGTDVSYHWVAHKSEPNELSLYAIRFFEDDSNKMKVYFNILRTWVLTHNIVISDPIDEFSNWAEGSVIPRKPKPGSYISDIMEKNGSVYVQYSHAGGFTFDDEWVYTFNASSGAGDYDMTDGVGSLINMKPVTPAAVKIKNWGRDTNGAGYDWYLPEDVFQGGGLQGSQWIGQCGYRGCYANHFRWRPCDFLGYTPTAEGDPKHIYADGDGHGTWNHALADSVSLFSSSESNHFPAYGKSEGNYNASWGVDNFFADLNSGFSGTVFGTNYGFTDYVVRPHEKGLINFSASPDEIGVLTHLEGKQLTTPITLAKHIKKWNRGFSFKKRYCTYNSTAPVLKDWDEHVIVTVSKHSYGTRQRCVPAGSKYYIKNSTSTTTIDTSVDPNQSVTTTTISRSIMATTDVHRLNGTTGAASWGTGVTNGLPGAEHAQPMTNTFRPGSYFNTNENDNTDNFPNSTWEYANNQHLYKLAPAGSEQSGQTDNDTEVFTPNNIGDLDSVSKNLEDTSYLFMSARKEGQDDTNTYIQWWNKEIHAEKSDGTGSVDTDTGGFTVSNFNHNPIEIVDMGSSIITHHKFNTTHHKINISPRVGSYKSGWLDFNPSGVGDLIYHSPVTGDHIDSVVANDKFWVYPDSALDFGMDIKYINTASSEEVANFKDGKYYYWKISMLYDGFQEGPLTTWEFIEQVPGGENWKRARLTLKIANPPKRVTHIVIYRKNDVAQFYRMVKEVSLADGWIYDTAKDQYKSFIIDEGKQGASYQAITGLPESLKDTSINYKLSTVAQGCLVVADCHHPQIKQGQNFVFKSEPNQFSNFNWSRSYTVLPNRPTHIIWWAGRIYAFDLSNIYKIEPMNLVLEDTYEGIGCIGPDSCIVTDDGMFFADYQGMYWHNGSRAENISRDIVHSSYGGDVGNLVESDAADDEEFNSHNWQHINHQRDPQVLYDGKTQSVYYCFEDKHEDGTLFSGAWVYSTTRKRWDLRELPTPIGKLTGSKNDIYVSNDTALFKVAASNNAQKKWEFHSKQFDMGASSLDKVFSSFKLVFNINEEATDFEDGGIGTAKFFVDEVELTSYNKEVEDNTLTFKFTTTDKKGKKFRFELSDMQPEIDSVAMLYRMGAVK